MKRNLKKWGIYTVLLWGITMIGVTSAYFSDYAKKENPMAVGTNPIQITEDFPDQTPIPEPDGKKTYKKVVCIGNFPDGLRDYNVDCYVRVYVSYSNSDIGKAVELLNLDTKNWVYQDGYYYYKNGLKEGEKTTALFTGFQIDPEKVEKTYQDKLDTFEINIYTESIGKRKEESYMEAWKAYIGI